MGYGEEAIDVILEKWKDRKTDPMEGMIRNSDGMISSYAAEFDVIGKDTHDIYHVRAYVAPFEGEIQKLMLKVDVANKEIVSVETEN